jgi:hypothetical protein
VKRWKTINRLRGHLEPLVFDNPEVIAVIPSWSASGIIVFLDPTRQFFLFFDVRRLSEQPGLFAKVLDFGLHFTPPLLIAKSVTPGGTELLIFECFPGGLS